jgi:hypothetical protein
MIKKQLFVYIVVSIGISWQSSFAATTPLADCNQACGALSSSQLNQKCSKLYEFDGHYVFDSTILTCHYTISSTPTSPGSWAVVDDKQEVVDCCATKNCEGVQVSIKVTTKHTATVNAGITLSYSQGIRAGINGKLLEASADIKTSAEFQSGAEFSSEKTEEKVVEGTKNPGNCGKKYYTAVAFRSSRGATGSIEFEIMGPCKCKTCNFISDDISMKTCTKTISFSGYAAKSKYTECDVTCSNIPNDACSSSATNGTGTSPGCLAYTPD